LDLKIQKNSRYFIFKNLDKEFLFSLYPFFLEPENQLEFMVIINTNLDFAREIYKELIIFLKNSITKWSTSKHEPLEKYREEKEIVLSKGLKYFEIGDELYMKVLTSI